VPVHISDLRRGPLGEVIGFVVVMGVMLSLPLLGASNRIIFLGVLVVIWAMVAYGLFVPFALAGQMTVATITVWGAASFSVALAASHWGWNLNILIPLGIAAGMAAAGIVALPVLRTSGHYFVVVTFAVAELGVIVGKNWQLLDNNDTGVTVAKLPTFLGWDVSSRTNMMRLCTLCLAVAFVGVIWLKGSRLGRRFAAIRENEDLARTVGCPVNVYKVLAFVLGGAIVGLAAPLYVFYTRHVSVADFGIVPGITIVVILVLGGRKYVLGPIFGALFWFLIPELISIDALLGQALFGAALAVAIIVAPDGLVAAGVSLFRFLGRVVTGTRRPSARAAVDGAADEDSSGTPGGAAPVTTGARAADDPAEVM
jgi:branched-chain amino acid transport system permease protein